MKVKIQFRTKLEMTLDFSLPLFHLWEDLTIALTFPIHKRKEIQKGWYSNSLGGTAIVENKEHKRRRLVKRQKPERRKDIQS